MAVVTTIIPTLGRDTLWSRALPSVLRQDFPHWRCIIVGDGVDIAPVDDARVTVTSIEAPEYPDDPLRRWQIGGVRAFNHGLDMVETEWFAYLADDDAYRANHHRLLLREREGADIVYGQSHGRGPGLYGSAWPPRWDDIVQGAYIMRTDTGHRATELPRYGGSGWDRDWWEDAITRALRFARVLEVVHDFHPTRTTWQ